MNLCAIQIELTLALLGLGVLLIDAFAPALSARKLGFLLAGVLVGLFVYSFWLEPCAASAWSGMVRVDSLALFFKRLFLLATILVLVVVSNDSAMLREGPAAFQAMVLFAASGMMLMAASADFFMLFVALELVTVSFYVLTSYLRRSTGSLEAGVKYLTLGTLSSSFLVFGIAFLYGGHGSTSYDVLRALPVAVRETNLPFLFGSMLVFAGLSFKIASVPFQMWAPDVYEGAPVPAAAFLAAGSKAAGFAVLVRLLLGGIFPVTPRSEDLLMIFAGASMLYGAVGAFAQRDLRRLMGYSSIAHAGFLMMGLVAANQLGGAALLFYLAQYVVTVLCVYLVLVAVNQTTGTWDLAGLAGLHRRAPLLALALFISMMSLAGVPPLSGALGKFFLFGAVLQRGATDWHFVALAVVGGLAVIASLAYYLGVVRAAYADPAAEAAPMPIRKSLKLALVACMAAIVLAGLFPQPLLQAARAALLALAPQ